jgi:hypothetical protein
MTASLLDEPVWLALSAANIVTELNSRPVKTLTTLKLTRDQLPAAREQIYCLSRLALALGEPPQPMAHVDRERPEDAGVELPPWLERQADPARYVLRRAKAAKLALTAWTEQLREQIGADELTLSAAAPEMELQPQPVPDFVPDQWGHTLANPARRGHLLGHISAHRMLSSGERPSHLIGAG